MSPHVCMHMSVCTRAHTRHLHSLSLSPPACKPQKGSNWTLVSDCSFTSSLVSSWHRAVLKLYLFEYKPAGSIFLLRALQIPFPKTARLSKDTGHYITRKQVQGFISTSKGRWCRNEPDARSQNRFSLPQSRQKLPLVGEGHGAEASCRQDGDGGHECLPGTLCKR